MRVKVTKSERELIERELRRGTTKSRIASLLHVNFETGCQMIQRVREQIRPEIGDQIRFTFRQVHMRGTIRKLLTNSAVVDIDWLRSDPTMKDICTSRTIVNFKEGNRPKVLRLSKGFKLTAPIEEPPIQYL